MAGAAFSLLLLVVLSLPAHGQAADGPAPALPPESEAKLTDFLKKAREATRARWEPDTTAHLERIARVTGLDAGRANALEAPARAAMDRSLEEWAAKVGKYWREWAEQMDAVRQDVLDQTLAQIAAGTPGDWFGDYTRPFEQPQWSEALRAALSAEQAAAWEKSEQERRQIVEKELGGTFLVTVERWKTQLRTSYGKKGAAIVSTLKLPPERAQKFDTLAESIAEASADKWRARARRMLLAMEDEQRSATLKRGNFSFHQDEQEAKNVEADWEAGVAKLLSADETVRLRNTQSEYQERRNLALAQIVVAQFDEQVAFTAGQRGPILAIATRLVRATPTLVPASEEGFFQIGTQNLLGLGRTVKSEELEPILDAAQRARWAEASASRSSSRALRVVQAPAAVASPAKAPPEPEDLEHAISDHLHAQTAAERKRLLAAHLLKAEDAARVAKLEESVVARLKTAARGSAEEELALWKASTDQSVRGQLRDVTLEGLKQRLARMDRFGIVRRTSSNAELGGIWDTAVKSELTPDQHALWQKELNARAAYRDQAITALIMAEFDRRVALTGEQYGKLTTSVAAMLKKYAPDIASMFSYSSGYAWYLASHSMFLPIAAVPEAELKALLTKEQWERWTGSPEFGNMTNYWENIQRIHGNRVREKKE